MYQDLYCKVFIDTELTYEELFTLIINYVRGKKESVNYINTEWSLFSVQKNKEQNTTQYLLNSNDFIYWKYYLDIEPCMIEEREYIKKIRDLMEYLKKYCKGVIIACDFEDELNYK